MRVLLMTCINRSYVVMPSLGLGYIASVLRKERHEVRILHSLKEKFSFKDFENYVRENQFDVVGIQMFTFDITPAKKHLEIIKSVRPETVTILGGYHPSGDPEGTLEQFPDADFAMRCEAEIAFPRFLDELQKKEPDFSSIPNLVWRDEGRTVLNPLQLVENLDDVPYPAWDLMDPRTYPEAPHGGFFKSFPTAPIIITRGCPMECTFCAGKCITTNRIRKRSVKNVIDEIKLLKAEYDVNDFLIEDENFTQHRTLVIDFCNTLLDQDLKITWSCPSGVRLDTLSEKMLRIMEDSGCHSLSLGVEFGSQRIHDLTRKHLTLQTIVEKTDLFKNVKIKTTGFFMFGIPGETKEEMMQTMKFAKALNVDRAQFNNFMPLPGSVIYEQLKERGSARIDYDHFFVHDVGYVPEGMTRGQMKNIQRRAYFEFYLRPKIIKGLLFEIASFGHFVRLVRRFVDALK